MALKICSCQRRAISWRSAWSFFLARRRTTSSKKADEKKECARIHRPARARDCARLLPRRHGTSDWDCRRRYFARTSASIGARMASDIFGARAQTPPSRPPGPPSICALRKAGESTFARRGWQDRRPVADARFDDRRPPRRGPSGYQPAHGERLQRFPNGGSTDAEHRTQASFGRQPLARL